MRCAVVGLGTMGPGIAATLARGGMDVVCHDLSGEQMKKPRQNCPACVACWTR